MSRNILNFKCTDKLHDNTILFLSNKSWQKEVLKFPGLTEEGLLMVMSAHYNEELAITV